MPIFFAKRLLAALRFSALWLIFFLLHRPRTKLRLILAIVLMISHYPFYRVLLFVSGSNFGEQLKGLIYRKTGAAGRFVLSALIRGG